MHKISETLKEKGHTVQLTTRHHPDTLFQARFLGTVLHCYGDYAPDSLETRLKASAKRKVELLNNLDEFDIAISHGSPELCSIAFGYGKPVITTFDSPQAEAVNKLTLPLSTYIVTSNAHEGYVPFEKENIVYFKGVDEVAWIKGFEPDFDEKLGDICDYPYIVIRDVEKSVYIKTKLNLREIGLKLSKTYPVIFIPRNRGEVKSVKEFTVLEDYCDLTSLVAHASLVIGIGGTICREACLQGTPTITIPLFKSYINDYLLSLGFPIYSSTSEKILDEVDETVGKNQDTTTLLNSLESPIEPITKLVEKI